MITLSKAQVLRLHSQLIKEIGGTDGIQDEGLLDSALHAPFQSRHHCARHLPSWNLIVFGPRKGAEIFASRPQEYGRFSFRLPRGGYRFMV